MGLSIFESDGPTRSVLTSAVTLAPGTWYRIAQWGNGESSGTQVRLGAEFTISDNQSGRHNFMKFHVAVAFGSTQYASIWPLQVTTYSNPVFALARLVNLNGTYGGQAIEVYCILDMAAGMQITVEHEDWFGAQRWNLMDFTIVPSTPTAPAVLNQARSLMPTGNWIPFSPMLNGWLNYDLAEATYAFGGYRMRPNSEVELRGLIRAGTISNSSAGNIFILPIGYRPHKRGIYTAAANPETTLRVDVTHLGEVVAIGGPGNNLWVSLNNIRFTAEQ
jgi:hypothetical protein